MEGTNLRTPVAPLNQWFAVAQLVSVRARIAA
jgi:hypothetical protein